MNIKYLIISLVVLTLFSCKKVLDTKPKNQILAEAQFATDSKANDAVVGMYASMYGDIFGNAISQALPLYTGLSADELNYTQINPTASESLFNNNVLNSRDPGVASQWSIFYSIIYQANSIIEHTQASGGISAAGKKQFIGEAKFIRALCYFYLVNMFGDVPLITVTDYHINSTIGRMPSKEIYQQMVSDLNDAIVRLNDNYPTTGRVRANKSAAISLLARVYLYMGDWAKASINATQVISNNNYILEQSYDKIFLSDSKEAVLQLYTAGYTAYGIVTQVNDPSNISLKYLVTPNFSNSFEPGDLRKEAFTTTVTVNGSTITYPSKYKKFSESNEIEYYMVLRLAEQYLIRAEAFAQQDNITDALADLNQIRTRAGLTELSASINKNDLLLAIEKERRIELCYEWGDRWFNLKRTGRANVVLGILKAGWTPEKALYPVPLSEIQNNSKLNQNPGY